MEQNSQPFPLLPQVIFATSTRQWWRFGLSPPVLSKQRFCTHLSHSPQPGIHYGQEVVIGEEFLFWWVCIV